MRSSADLLPALILAAALASPCSAAFSDDDRGTSAGQFLKLGAGARAASMGGAHAAIAEGAEALYWNPAALARQTSTNTALFQHAQFAEFISFDHAAYSRRISGLTAAASFTNLSYAAIDRTDALGNAAGSFKPRDWALTLGAGRALPGGGSFGAAVKRVSSRIVRSDSTNALDLGLLSPPLFGGDARLGFSVHNLGGKLRFRQESNPLPVMIRLGSSYRWNENWLWALDVRLPRDRSPGLAIGTERLVSAAGFGFALRAGFNTAGTDPGGIAGLSFGLGLGRASARQGFSGGLRLDYAFVPLGDLGSAHQISIGASF